MADEERLADSGETRGISRQPQPGDRIGPYRVEGSLGKGGMGEVLLAYDERLDRRVAIKRIRHDVHTTAAERERFHREARVAARLSHPAIVQVHDILSDDSGEAIVMERVRGCSLAQRLKAGPLPLAEALRLARQVAEGLAEAHRIGLVHRDLKAENVMITAASGDHPGRAKILDFGLAKQLLTADDDETLTRRGALVGTVRAMSPEQAEGDAVDHRSDLFSLGVLLYEMLTRRSPFRGDNAIATLRRLLLETPRPVRELRPDVPAELEKLIGRLLEKPPERRPSDAGEVARTLKDLAARTPGASGPLPVDDSDSLSDVPTGSFAAPGAAAAAEAQRPAAAGLVRNGRRWLLPVVGVALLAVLAVAFLRGRAGRSEPLRVVVLRPEVVSAEPLAALDLVASGVRIAALAVLADLESVAPVEPSEMGDSPGKPQEIALAEAADEVLVANIGRRDGNARVFLRLIRGADGEVRWAKAFDVPLRAGRVRLVAEGMTVQLQRAYPESRLRDTSRLKAGDADFAEFVRIAQRIDSGEAPLEPELRRLAAIIERSPRFLAAQLRAVLVALTLYTDTQEIEYLDRAAGWIRQARKLAPDDPRALQLELRTALARGEPEAAEAVLAELTTVAPNSAEVLLGRYRLAQGIGDFAAAEAAMEEVVERRPSWGNLYRLANLKYRRGEVAGARGHLDELIRRAPNNTWGLSKLVQLELLYGDLERAERLALRALEILPHRSLFNNLGLARFFLGNYEAAKTSYLQALDVDPGHLTVQLNLADAELALGQREQALIRYRRILEDLENDELEATEKMTLAQCLAHLGEAQRAVAVTLETLQEHPDHAEVAYQAALVYALVGETASALVNVERALAHGLQPRQFEIPGFDSLLADPRFRDLLGPEQ